MKALILGWETPRVFEHGGLGVFVRHLADHLAKHGVEVEVAGGSPTPPVHVERPYPTYAVAKVVDLSPRNVLQINLDLAYMVRRRWREFDVVNPHDYHSAVAVLAAKASGTPAVYSTHTVAGSVLETAAVVLADAVIANSNLTKSILESVVKPYAEALGISTPETHVVHPTAPELKVDDEVRTQSKVIRLELGSKYIVSCVARNQFNKGVDVFEKAVNMLAGKLDVKGVVAGRGWEWRVSGNVVYVGEVSEELKSAIYLASDAFVMPSTFEPFGMVALEAASLGIPVVVSENVGVREVMTTAVAFKTGSPEDLASKLEELLTNPRLREEFSAKQREEATKRGWGDVAEEYVRIYRKAIKNPRNDIWF